MFRGLLIERTEGGGQTVTVRDLDEADLPDGDVVVEVAWSTLNYKDALAITGRAPIVRTFPMVPGIDFAGTVARSVHAQWQVGDQVILNGWGASETFWGGMAAKARVSGERLIAVPDGMTARTAMAIGTAGYTAALALRTLERSGVTPDRGDILVTGATGGVGSIAVMILAAAGYRVVAATGKPEGADYLTRLGASRVIDRAELAEPGRPLQKERWAGAIDSLGGTTLANICAQMMEDGVVTACGQAQGMDLPASVAPFILRGVTLAGMESVRRTRVVREECWQSLARLADVRMLDGLLTEIELKQVVEAAERMLEGRSTGRAVVRL